MKLSTIRINTAAIEGGAWVGNIPGLGDARLRVRGIDNLDYRRRRGQLIDGLGPESRDEGGRVLPEVLDTIASQLLHETVLLGWDGIESEDSTEEARQLVPYSPETAKEYLSDPDFAAFNNGVAWAAAKVAERGFVQREADEKN